MTSFDIDKILNSASISQRKKSFMALLVVSLKLTQHDLVIGARSSRWYEVLIAIHKFTASEHHILLFLSDAIK